MKEPVWMDRADALAIHEKMLAWYGGLAGVRDEGLLDSALGKPLNQFRYGHPTLAELAASYAAGVVRNHPYIDGNKRTGFVLGAAFLELNGQELVASEADVVERTLALAAGVIGEAEYGAWLKANSRPA